MAVSLRRGNADDLGLRHAMADRLLPVVVGAMVFLAALALGGALGAARLAAQWKNGAASMLTVSVPRPDEPQAGTTRAGAIARALAAASGVVSARRLPSGEIAALLKPWLGADAPSIGLHMPAIFEVRAKPGGADPDLARRLDQVVAGTLTEDGGQWLARLAALAASLQACAALILLVVTFVAAATVSVATRAGLAAQRDAIEIVHGLGATDRLIAGHFARRVSMLVLPGALIGAACALPLLMALTRLAAPFAANEGAASRGMPTLWILLASLPPAAALIGWLTTRATVHAWLRRLP